MQSVPPNNVLDLIEAFRLSKTMFAAVEMGVFDRLSAEARNAAALARATGAAEEPMERLLDACVALGLLEKDAGIYRNSAEAELYLTRHSPNTLTGYVLYSDRVLYSLWQNLSSAVREGTHRWKQTFGLEGALFGHFFRTEESMQEFLLGMHGFGQISSPAVVAAFDLSGFRRMVDLGGATGHLAIAACKRYPDLQGAVFDLPRVIEAARPHIAAAEMESRIELIPGDFFTDPLPQADLYAVGRILHDWSEEKIEALLGRIHESLPAGGALLIAERILDDDHTRPLSGLMQSLNMLICTEGRERSLPEYQRLLEAAGFKEVDGRRTGTPLDAILARKR
jgi:acetylserotonin O-methyltransferase